MPADAQGVVDMDEAPGRDKRKEEGRRLKRQRIAESGGKRPRQDVPATRKTPPKMPPKAVPRKRTPPTSSSSSSRYHQFGRVMDAVPCRNKPRKSTLSMALPGSVVSNCQTKELRTQLVGQIARAATIYHVDEIVVFDDKLAKEVKSHHFGSYRKPRREDSNSSYHHPERETSTEAPRSEAPREQRTPFDPHGFMAKLLQYCECPQYLRRTFFPMHPDLQFAGLLAPVDAPHHVRAEDRCRYREGVVMDKVGPNKGGSLVNCGIRSRPVEIDVSLPAGIRCTVQLEKSVYDGKGRIQGKVVSPAAPREENGTYWGYTVRMADSLKSALEECPFEGGYDLKIGTSERGTHNLDDRGFVLPSFQHALIVFGGVAGIEECVDADESFKLPGSESRKLFDMWVNVCQFQGSRTIRTEEAVLITLAKLSPLLAADSVKSRPMEEIEGGEPSSEADRAAAKEFELAEAPSEESSDSDGDGDDE